MKYKNITVEDMFFKVRGEWVSVNPGATIELMGRNIENKEKGLVMVSEEDNVKSVVTNEIINEPIIENVDNKFYLYESELAKMTKDELNDYAARRGFSNIKSTMRKGTMIQAILKSQEQNNE